jgi:hypothetical protein
MCRHRVALHWLARRQLQTYADSPGVDRDVDISLAKRRWGVTSVSGFEWTSSALAPRGFAMAQLRNLARARPLPCTIHGQRDIPARHRQRDIASGTWQLDMGNAPSGGGSPLSAINARVPSLGKGEARGQLIGPESSTLVRDRPSAGRCAHLAYLFHPGIAADGFAQQSLSDSCQ